MEEFDDNLLDAREERFVNEYLTDLDPERAAKAAGYADSVARTKAYVWVSNSKHNDKPHVMEAVMRRRDELSRRYHVTQEKIVAEYAKLAFANTLDYIEVTKDGYAVVDLSQLTRDQAAAISELTVDEYLDGRGEDAREVKKVKFKLADKKGALDSLAKHLGMFIERHEHTVTGLSDEERADRILGVLAGKREAKGAGPSSPPRAN